MVRIFSDMICKGFKTFTFLSHFRYSHWELLTHVTLDKSNINVAGDLSLLSNVSNLSLSSSLITTWGTVADIVRQLPSLCYLDFS